MRSVRALLAEITDYAGLFPPAHLNMAQAVMNYARGRKGPHAWMLGRFIVPSAGLEEFAEAAEPFLRDCTPWRLSVLCGLPPGQDLQRVEAFRQRGLAAEVDTLEIKTSRPEEIAPAMEELPEKVTAYFEVPLAAEPSNFTRCIADSGARAKMRTGGITPESIPDSQQVARFILSCAEFPVPFKATAGLHHPFRGSHRLTPSGTSSRAPMHGFLNVFLASAFAKTGANLEEMMELLNEESFDAFTFEDGGIRWRKNEFRSELLAETRRTFAIAFGSCSFEEPVEDLKALSLL